MSERFVFQTSGYHDTPDDIAENVNAIPGKALINAVVNALAKHGFHSPDVFPEDWGWCFEIQKDGTNYLGGGLIYQDFDTEPNIKQEASAFIEHRPRRGLGDIIFGRNKARQDLSEAAMAQLKTVLEGFPDVSDIEIE